MAPAGAAHLSQDAAPPAAAALPYTVVTWSVPAGSGEAVEELLGGFGLTSYALSAPASGPAELVLYLSAPVDPHLTATLASQLEALGAHAGDTHATTLGALLQGLQPGEPHELLPGVWVDPTQDWQPPPGAIALRIPALPAFGDGHHPSTRMAAALVASLPAHGPCLDLGCGTGILAALAGRRGAQPLVLSDIDPDAVRAAAAVMAAQRLAATVVQADLLDGVPTGPYRLVIANLYADVLLRLADAPAFPGLLREDADLILSGIALPRRPAVLAAFARHGWDAVALREDGWWGAAHCRRR